MTPSIHTEKELLSLVASGDTISFRLLFDQYRNKLFSLAMYLTRSEILSEEIVQDVFIKVWEKREQLREVENFNAWLKTIARNTCFNYLRSLAAERTGLAKLAETSLAKEQHTYNNSIGREYDQLLQAAIYQLPAQQQKVYILHRQQGLKHEEIARELGISTHTSKEYMKLAMRSIRKFLEGRIDIAIMLAIALYLD